MKKTVTYTVEENVLKMFNETASKNAINKSKWIEKQMEKFVLKGGK